MRRADGESYIGETEIERGKTESKTGKDTPEKEELAGRRGWKGKGGGGRR